MGFSGYNQVLVSHTDQLLTGFRTKWGTFCFRKMPFGLINAGATFQRAMDIVFRGLINESVVVYLDDVTIYSKKCVDHLDHLRQVLERCRKYDISLNPKKSIFAVTEGKLLGFIVLASGMTIEPERIQAIEKIQMPFNKKGMQSFLGKINFVKRFVLAFSEVVRPMQNMIKKVVTFKWNELEKEAFVKIKTLIAESPALLSPDFNKEFYLYTFASDLSYAGVLTQRNAQGDEVRILFTSSAFIGAELNYPEVDKQSYAVFKTVKHFRPYLIKSKTNVIMPFLAVQNLLVQKDLGEKIVDWVTALQEYDLEIKPSKIVRGQGLCKLVVEGNDDEMRAVEEEKLELEEGISQAPINIIEQRQDSWYYDLKQLLITGAPPEGLNPKQKRELRLKSEPYH